MSGPFLRIERRWKWPPPQPSWDSPIEPKAGKIVRQCMKCWFYWPERAWTRKDGTPRVACPRCRSVSTLSTHYMPTKVVLREDLIMLTYGKYPSSYCPATGAEELGPSPRSLIEQRGGVVMYVGRGFGVPPTWGHEVRLVKGSDVLMTTGPAEVWEMLQCAKQCPPNARAFVAGLGLGIVLLWLAKLGKAREVIVAELDGGVVEIVEPRIRWWFERRYPEFEKGLEIVRGDAFEEVEKRGKFDWIFWDVWGFEKARVRQEEARVEIEVARRASIPRLTDRGVLTVWAEDYILMGKMPPEPSEEQREELLKMLVLRRCDRTVRSAISGS